MMSKLQGAKVLVTGGAGFIGSELVRQLAEEGASVRALDNLTNGHRENLEGLSQDRVELVEGDIRDERIVSRLMREVDLVYHLACLGVRHSIHSPEENHEINATGTLKLLLWAKEAGVDRFVYVSSSEVYGTARSVPMTEEHPPFPKTVYGASKLAAECYARAFYETYGFPTVVVRPFNAYGPRSHHEGDCGEVIPKFMLRALAGRPLVIFGDGTQTRDFTYVTDTVRGILLAGICEKTVGETFNLGSQREVAINDLAGEVGRVVGLKQAEVVHEERRPGDALRLYADTAKARRLLGFEPQVSLQAGLAKLKEWYLGLDQSIEELLKEEIVLNWKAK